ncbi:unnamed protein product, partial [Mesorhabditis belari]|uniref:Saposin B-type domain-containing protein n=1 Tax=Mesorhabditis belari TaxID=2138241 RepID=A0AAF3F6E1_9BILA
MMKLLLACILVDLLFANFSPYPDVIWKSCGDCFWFLKRVNERLPDGKKIPGYILSQIEFDKILHRMCADGEYSHRIKTRDASSCDRFLRPFRKYLRHYREVINEGGLYKVTICNRYMERIKLGNPGCPAIYDD